MRVLLVDDEKELLDQAKIFLERDEKISEVETIISPDDALDKIKDEEYDVIVSDYQMPKINGLEFLEIIKKERDYDIPFIMFTGRGREEVAMEALNLGADRYIQKGGEPKSQYGVLIEAVIQEVEHHRTKKSLETRKKQFERAIQNSPYPAILQAEDGEVLSINKEWTEITGYKAGEISHISDWTEKAYGEDKNSVEAEIEDLFDKEARVDEGIYTITTKNGEERKWDFSTSPLGKLPDGRRLILSMANDITERIEAENALRESKDKFKALYENAPLPYQSLDEEGQFKDVNPAWTDTLGYDRKEIIGKNFSEFLHPDMKDKFDNKFHEFKDRGYVHDVHFKMKHKDGHFLDVLFEGCIGYNKDGDFKQTYCVFKDITERKKAEEQLKRSEQKYRTVFENTGTATCIIEEDTTLSLINNEFEELSGYSKEEIEGEMSWKDFVIEEDLKRMKTYHTKRRKEDENAPTKYEFDFIDRYDELHHILLTIDVIPKTKKSVASLMDITDLKNKEKELQEERNFLEQIAEMSPVCITKLDTQGEIIYANDRAEDVLGLSKSEIKGRTYNDVKWNITDYDGDDFPDEKLPFNQVKEKGEPVYDIKHAIEWPNGEWKLLSINAAPIYDEEGNFDGMVATIQNVTEKEKKERKLKESRRRLRTLMDNIPGMAYRCKNNKNWTMKFISEGCRMLTGYKPDDLIDDEVVAFKDIIHPEDREFVWKNIQKAVYEGDSFTLEYRIKTSSGETKWVWERGRKISTDDEEFLEGIITDITERKKIERELKKSEEKYKSLFYETPLGTFHYDENGVITDCNQNFVDIIGSSKDELIGFDMLNRLEDDELLDEVRSSLQEGEGYYEGDYKSLTADKTTPVRILLKGMRDEERNIYAGIGLVEDITEQKEREHEVEKEKERYESLFEENPEAIVEVDGDFNVIKANSKFIDLFKYEEDEILGEHLDDLVVPQDKVDEAEKLNRESKKKGYFDHETVRVDKYGSKVPVAITGRPIKHGDETHHLAVYRDISERKKAEEREDFLHSLLRHDVRNKAQLAMGYLELLEDSCENEIQEDYVGKATMSIKEAEDIINKVSKLRKIENEEEIKDIDISSVLKRVLSEVEGQLKDNNIDVRFDEEHHTVKGGVLLEELFYNIIENSIKHSNCSSIEIKIEPEGEDCWVSISDDGKGIPNRYKDKVFEKGFKKGKNAGSGLGMYMVKEIAENYNGRVKVIDSIQDGTKFEVALKSSDQ